MGWLKTTTESNRLPNIAVREPSLATKAISYYSPGYAMVPEWDAERAFKMAYLSNAIVFRCVQIIANDIATLPLRVGPDPDKPENYRKTHPFAKMMSPPPGGPNPTFSSHTLLKHAIASLIVAGRFGWEIEATAQGGIPMRLWPLTTHRLRPVPSNGGMDWFTSYEYTVADTHAPRILRGDQVHYQWFPGQMDFRQPESVIEAARLDISVAIMQDQYDYSFLQNDARPAALIVHERFSDPAAQAEFRAQLTNEHRGPTNKGKIAWMAHDPNGEVNADKVLSIQTLSLSHEDGQFIQRYKEKIRNITSALGVPMSKLDASGRTFDNAKAEDKTYWIDTIRPLADFLAGNFSMGLLPRYGDTSLAAWFDFSSVEVLNEKPEPIFTPAHVGDFLDRKIATRNEIRKDYGLAPVSDGDKFEEPKVDPIDAAVNSVLNGDNGSNSSNSGTGGKNNGSGSDDSNNNSANDSNRQRVVAQLLLARWAAGSENRGNIPNGTIDVGGRSNGIRNSDVDDGGPINDTELLELRKLRLRRETEVVVDTLETRVERAMKGLFTKQETIVKQRLNSRRGKMFTQPAKYNVEVRAITGNVFDFDYWRRITTELAHNLYEDIFTAGGLRIAKLLGFKLDMDQEYINQFINERSNNLAGHVTNTTYKQIQETLATGANKGETLEELTTRVSNVFTTATTTRARSIAQTEVNSAYNGAALKVAQTEQNSDLAAQRWITMRDNDVRDSHAKTDGQTVLLGEQFNVNSIPCNYPGDPLLPAEEVINCRCTLLFLKANEISLTDLVTV